MEAGGAVCYNPARHTSSGGCFPAVRGFDRVAAPPLALFKEDRFLSAGGKHRKQVRLATFENEPLARLAEQRLRDQGIPCLSRSLGGGPGLWGSSFNIPHEVLVYGSDVTRARDLLELPPLEIAERQAAGAGEANPPLDRRMLTAGVIIVVLVIFLALRI